MKRLWLISAIVIPLLLFGFFLSCDNAGGLSGYYIYAELDGTAYEWRLGLTLIEDDAFATRMTFDDPDFTSLIATPDVEMGLDEPFTPHDLRRTVRTRLAEIGIPDVIAERVLGHKLQGLFAVYNQHSYDNEKRQALIKWENKLSAIIGEGHKNNVIQFSRKGA